MLTAGGSRSCHAIRRATCGLAALRQSVRGGDAQPDRRVQEEQEVNDRRRHREMAQDQVERAVLGGVEGLAGIEGEDVVGRPLLELPLRHKQGGAGVGAGEGPLLPAADHAVALEHLRDRLMWGPVSSFMSNWPRAMGW